jgi:hypothetical protein
MNPNLRDLARETKNPDLEAAVAKEVPGFTYIPGLRLYVKDTPIKLSDKSFWTAREAVTQEGGQILTPREFWVYYDYCQSKDKVHELILSHNSFEWLDAIIPHDDSMIVRPESESITGKTYKPILIGSGGFERAFVDKESGLPTAVAGGNDHDLLYHVQFDAMYALTISCFNWLKLLMKTCLTIIPNAVRPCYSDIKKINLEHDNNL